MTAFLRSQKTRRAILQLAFVGFVAFIVIGGWLEARQSIRTMGLASGFDFLWRATGWNINFSLFPVRSTDPYWWFFVNGVVNTLFLGTLGLIFATLIGALVGIARVSANELLQLLGRIYVDFFRNIPLILQLFFWYAFFTSLPSPRNALEAWPFTLSNRGVYMPALNLEPAYLVSILLIILLTIAFAIWLAATRRIPYPSPLRNRLRLIVPAGLLLALFLVVMGWETGSPLFNVPELQGLNLRGGLRISPEFSALLTAMALYGGAYIGEIVRGGFKAVDRGQVEAAQSLGLTPWQIFTRIRFPLALRAMLPILANQYIWLIKATTLGIAVGFADFFMVVAVTINQSGQTLESIGILMGGFLIINLTLAAIFNRFNKALALKGNQLRS